MINIAELLKYKKEGYELYSPICGECRLINVGSDYIKVASPETDLPLEYNQYGQITEHGEVLLFPNKKTRTWENFDYNSSFEDGDIVVLDAKTPFAKCIYIVKTEINNYYLLYNVANDQFNLNSSSINDDRIPRLATSKERILLLKN